MGVTIVTNGAFVRFRQAGVFSELAILFPTVWDVQELLSDLGADRTGELTRLPSLGHTAFELYWRKVGEQIDRGMFARFDLDDLAAEALRRFPGNAVLLTVASQGREKTGDLRILCLLADPDRRSQLRLRQEHRIILEIASRRGPRTLTVTANPATRRNDIIGEILAARPDIVHFAGHGTSDGRLVFEQEDGAPSTVRADALAAALGLLPSVLSCLVLGSCFSGTYADTLLGPTLSVAGSATALDDGAALEFTRGFYTALATGNPGLHMADAFGAGCAQMEVCGYTAADMCFESLDSLRPGGR